jgi:tRNA threonylcarbamoyladenosine modification (KEOPS) complex  Pcc1 subunit
MRATATVRLKFARKDHLSAALGALEPETRTVLSSRSKVTVKMKDKTLTLVFEAKDTSALRAALNSYLHWIRLTKDVLDTLSRNA